MLTIRRLSALPIAILPLLIASHLAYASDLGAPKPTPAYAAYTRGTAALSEGHLDEARASFSQSLQLDPKMVPALLGLAEVSIRQGNPKAALQPLQRAVSLAPKDPKVQTSWGHYLFWQKQYGQAKTAFNKAIALDPYAAKPWEELGDLNLLGLHEPRQAIECYRAALGRDPGRAPVHFLLSNALIQVGDLDGATKQLEEATHLAPANLTMLYALGGLYARRGLWDQATDSFSRAVAAEPRFAPGYLARGLIYAQRGHPDQALTDFEAAIRIMPKPAEGYVDIGMVQQQNHRLAEAELAYRTAIRLEPGLAVAYNNLAWLEVQQNQNLDEAVSYAKKAAELGPKVATFQDTLGWAYRAHGQREQAITALQNARALDPQDPEILYHLGLVYSESGQKDTAREALRKALALKKGFQEADAARAQLAALTSGRALPAKRPPVRN